MDGVTHINVYSQGKTELGRALSNFAHTPFVLHGQRFESVESFWYWVKFNHVNMPEAAEKVKRLVGFQAKRFWRGFGRVGPGPTKGQLKEAYLAKLEAHPEIQEELLKSTLPFAHYYVYDGKVKKVEEYLWTAELWGEIRNDLRLQRI